MTSPTKRRFFFLGQPRKGVALVLVLAFVVLLASIIVAFFSRVQSEQQISRSSANQAKVKLLADGAVDTVVGNVKQEIVTASTSSTPAPGVMIYTPKLPKDMVPARDSNLNGAAGLENLVKVSTITGGKATNDASESRKIDLKRWNKPLFVTPNSATDDTPATAFPTVPQWIYVQRDGKQVGTPNASASNANTNAVVGRYAYVVYDEGGLLDINVAGYPSTLNPAAGTPDVAYKNAQAYADLTQIGFKPAQIDALVNWRNEATQSVTDGYKKYVAANTTGFLRTANIALSSGVSDRMFSSRQQFIEFFKNKIPSLTKATLDTLQYLTTFSRDLNQPSYAPNSNRPKVLSAAQGGNSAAGASGIDDKINPSYLTVRVQKSFTRNDGSTANPGDALVNKRFALNRLAWLTCKGPSATRTQSDPDIQALINNGIPWSYLQLGTAENIQKYFGLNWNGSQWLYNIHNGAGSGKGSIMRVGRPPSDSPNGAIYVEDLATGRDPDFFELLKSAITVGSLGKALVATATGATPVAADPGAGGQSEQPYNYNYDPERSVDRQIIQIGANMINQSRPDNFPVQIVFDDGVGNRNALASASTATTVVGVADIPYLYYIFNGVLQVQAPSILPRAGKGKTPKYTNTGASDHTSDAGTGVDGDSGYQAGDTITNSGVGAIMQIPALWNPNDPASPRAVDGPTAFRIVADSTTPDQVGANTSNYSKFFAYATSGGTTVSSGPNTNSYNGTGPNSPWYRSPSQTGSEIAHPITASNNEIDFTASSNTAQLFPEPTMLLRFGSITDSNGNAVAVKLGGTPLMSTDPAVSAEFSTKGGGKGLASFVPDPLRFSALASPATPYPTTTPYLGFYLGAFPWAWNYPGGAVPLSGAQSGATLSRVTGGTGGSANACYLTYRVQCKDAFGNWMTYDTKYGKVSDGQLAPGNIGNTPAATNPRGALLPGPSEKGFWATVTDPRTSRFGIQWNGTAAITGVNNASPTGANGGLAASVNQVYQGGWLNYANGILKTNRPDAQSGFYFMACWRNTGMPTATSGWMAWSSNNAVGAPGLAPGLLSQNNPDIHYSPSRTYGDGQGSSTDVPNYFADPDGIVRRGMGAFVPIGTGPPSTPSGDNRTASADTTVGLPVARVFAVLQPQSPFGVTVLSPTTTNYTPGKTLSQAQSRPYFLHRPFRSVAELGCVFSDTPWRNLDFFTSESGNTALLDVFCIADTDDPAGLVAGKVNLNTKQQPVLKAVLAGTYLDPANISTGAVTGLMSATTANNMALALMTYINSNGPIQNLAELVGKWKSNVAITHPAVTGFTSPPLTAPFYDGKRSYVGFSGGQWDSTNHKPKVTSPAADVYSVYMGASDFSSTNNHNGTRETVAYIQRIREAPIRALTASGQTRVWNLMIDVMAQTGRYPQSASTLANFVVEGEQRYWVHLAIDRFTGQVIDKQIEVVKE